MNQSVLLVIPSIFRSRSETQFIEEAEERSNSSIDRELLIKELCDYNFWIYPHSPETVFDYLVQTGFVLPEKDDLMYSIPIDKSPPEDILELPPDWQERLDKYIETGSVLFSYLTVQEIVN